MRVLGPEGATPLTCCATTCPRTHPRPWFLAWKQHGHYRKRFAACARLEDLQRQTGYYPPCTVHEIANDVRSSCVIHMPWL